MRKRFLHMRKGIAAGILFVLCVMTGTGIMSVQAEEMSGYFDEAGNWISDEPLFSEETIYLEDTGSMMDIQPMTGTYTVADGWAEDTDAGEEEEQVYKQSAYVDMEGTSTITCSYMDTNYSVLEYEQLRDMLTNNLLYSKVNAQISASAIYTEAKDYLYILIVDDSSEAYRDIYHYVVGDYRCFCVEVREYRADAEQAKAQDQQTPQEAGQEIAESFTWDTVW